MMTFPSVPTYFTKLQLIFEVMAVLRYGGMELWRYGVMVVWSYGGTELWRYGVMVVWSYGGMELWRY